MERRNQTKRGPPLEYCFVSQSGRKVDQSAQKTIRSHAMKDFWNTQRRNKRLEILRGAHQSVLDENRDVCRCSPQAQLSPSSPGHNAKRPRLDAVSKLLDSAPKTCNRCGKVQLSRMGSQQQMDDLQQLSGPVATFAAADFDPFNSITELPPALTSKFSNEIDDIKKHG